MDTNTSSQAPRRRPQERPHVIVREYIELGRKCASITMANYSAIIKEGSVSFEYTMSKSVLRLTGGVRLCCEVNLDYVDEDFHYVIRFVQSALEKWFEYEEEDAGVNDYYLRFRPLDLPKNIEVNAYTYLDALLNKKTEIEVNDIITKFDLAQEHSGGGFHHLSYKHNGATWLINPIHLEPHSDFATAPIMIDAWIGLRTDTPCMFSLYSIDGDDDYYDISFGYFPKDSGYLSDPFSLEQGLIHIRDNFNVKTKEFTS